MWFNFSLLILIMVFSSGCETGSHHPFSSWKTNDVAGLTISLNDPKKEEWYSFHKNGTVSVTYGAKRGEIIFPLYHWRIRSGSLLILNEDKQLFQELRFISRKCDLITVKDMAGKTVEFRILNKI